MNMLVEKGVTFNVIQALYGHDQRDQELFLSLFLSFCTSVHGSGDSWY